MDDLELLAVRANAASNGIRIPEPASFTNGKYIPFLSVFFLESMHILECHWGYDRILSILFNCQGEIA